MTYLSSGIDNLRGVVLAPKPDHFTKGVLDGRVVALDKVAVDELDREGGFACCQGLKVSIGNVGRALAIECLHT